ncbi:MAG: amino acid permease [Deltaproteobacteria bacterium]
MANLERRLDLSAVVAISISAMLGSGIFVLPGIAAAKTGPSVWLAYLVAGLCVLPAALSKGELATAMPSAGGTYIYLDRTFGPLVGTISGLGLWLSLLLKSSFALLGLGVYLLVVVDVPVRPVALAFLGAIVLLNIVGVKGVGRVQKFVTAVALAMLVVLTLTGVFGLEQQNLENGFPLGALGFVDAVGFVVISYAGVTKVAAIAEEVKNPARNLPAGMLLSLIIVMIIYSLVAFVMVGGLGLEALSGDLHPIYALAVSQNFPTPFTIGVAVIGTLTMVSMATAGLLAGSRFPFAMSRDDLLPPVLKGIHQRFLTPIPAILATGAIMFAAIAFLEIEKIAKLASAFMLMMFGAVNLAVIILRETGVQWYKPAFRSPLYPWVQIFGVVTNLGLIAVMGPLAVAAGVSIAVPGLFLFLLYGRKRVTRSGVLTKRLSRQEMLKSNPGGAVPRSGNDVRPLETEEPEEAAVVVALFGKERSPEILVELGQGLAHGGRIEVVYLTEVPEQSILSGWEEDPTCASVRRRIQAMAETNEVELDFEALPTYDQIDTVHRYASRLNCEWVVMEWSGRARDAFTIGNPIGWLKDHLPANLARFHDAGVRYIRKILVHAEPGANDALVAYTADKLAREHGASLTFIRYVPQDADASREASEKEYLEQIRQLCEVDAEIMIARGKSEAEVIATQSAFFDLLVTTEVRQRSIVSRVVGTISDRLSESAVACSVLRVLSPPNATHQALERIRARPNTRWKSATLASYFDADLIRAQLPAQKKDALFLQMARALSEAKGSDLQSDQILASLWERERSLNTGIGNGIALPHATVPTMAGTRVGVFTCREPIDYGAADGVPVDVFVVTIGGPSDRNAHLDVLASMSKMLSRTDLLSRLRAAETTEAIFEAVHSADDAVGGDTAPARPAASEPAERVEQGTD